MTKQHQQITVTRAYLDKPFQEFYVQIEPMSDSPDDGKAWYDIILCCKEYGHRMHICGHTLEAIEEEIDWIKAYAVDHIGLWIEEINALEHYFLEQSEK